MIALRELSLSMYSLAARGVGHGRPYPLIRLDIPRRCKDVGIAPGIAWLFQPKSFLYICLRKVQLLALVPDR